MRRGVARGRMVPQSLSTDPRYGRLSLKAQVLYPLLWVNADDQGRVSGDPDEIKYAVCPSVKQVRVEEIPRLLEQMQTHRLIKVYSTSEATAIQMLDWWGEQKLQWAWPSRFQPPEGWQDRLRYKKSAKEVITVNWGVSPENSPESSPELSAFISAVPPLTTPLKEEKEKEEEKGRGRGKSPEPSGEKSSPSLTADISIFKELTRCFKIEWGRVPAQEPHKIIRREPSARESAQLRDLAKNLYAAGGVPLDYIKQAFREAASHDKRHISYVRVILLDWLGVPRGPP